MVLGVGIGGDWFGDYGTFGEPTDDKTHAEMLDEGLDVINGLWSGEPFSYEGTHYQVKNAHFLPRPVQEPRVPIWVAGLWPNKAPFRRAARWDGVCPLRKDQKPITPQDFREIISFMNENRPGGEPFDVIFGSNLNKTEGGRSSTGRRYAGAVCRSGRDLVPGRLQLEPYAGASPGACPQRAAAALEDVRT